MTDKSRTIVVTGGSKGIGLAICLEFAGSGTHIFFNYSSDEEAARKAEKKIAAKGAKVTPVCVDVTKEDRVKEFASEIIKETGGVDVLVNNAGITRDGLILRMKAKDWDMVMDVNLKGAFHCCKFFAKSMLKKHKGRIINISSVVGVTGNPGQANYVASKAGIIGFTKALARELASRNITVNAVAPGYVETEMTDTLSEKARKAMLATIPLGRTATPADVAHAVKFLASHEASYITGQVIHVNGGMYM